MYFKNSNKICLTHCDKTSAVGYVADGKVLLRQHPDMEPADYNILISCELR